MNQREYDIESMILNVDQKRVIIKQLELEIKQLEDEIDRLSEASD